MTLSGFIIQRRGDVSPTWFSITEGRNSGSPLGGWTTEATNALHFVRRVDAQQFMDTFIKAGGDLSVVPTPGAA